MNNYILKRTILVKEKAVSNILTLDTERDHVYEFSGDVANLLLILYRNSLLSKSLSKETMISELEKQSESFKQNEFKEDCIQEAIHYLTQENLIELSE